jgi:uncharacterized protein YjeT (DUF2065 family)
LLHHGLVLDMFVSHPGGPLNWVAWLTLAVGVLLAVEGAVTVVSPGTFKRIVLRRQDDSVPDNLMRAFGAMPLVFGAAAIIVVVLAAQGHSF